MLEIPTFLDRRKYDENGNLIRMTDTEIKAILNPGRQWAPITTHPKIKEPDPVYAENINLPVQVVTTDRKNLQTYSNFEEFEKQHDKDALPIKRLATAGGTTYVVVKEPTTIHLSPILQSVPVPFTTDVYKNGIKRPKNNTLCGKAWAIYDRTLTGEFTVPQAQEFLKQEGMNASTVRTQYTHWRRFNGIEK